MIREKSYISTGYILIIFLFMWACDFLTPNGLGPHQSTIIKQVLVTALLPILIIRAEGKNIGFNLKIPSLKIANLALITGTVYTILAAYLTVAITSIINVPKETSEWAQLLLAHPTPHEYLTQVFVIAILPAICEEIFFRGICLTAISARYGNKLGYIISSLLFYAAHLNLYYFPKYFLDGCFFAWTYKRTRTLWFPIICHFLNNFIATTMTYLGAQYSRDMEISNIIIVATCSAIILIVAIARLNSLPRVQEETIIS